MGAGELKQIDYWLYSKLNKKINAATEAMENLEFRSAYQAIFYDSMLELKRYFARGGNNAIVVKEYLNNIALMLQPIAPHFAEELWHMLGNETFVSTEKWPQSKNDLVNEKVEQMENTIDSTIDDAKQVIALMQKKSGKEIKELKVIVAKDIKRTLYNEFAKEKDMGKVLSGLDEKQMNKDEAAKLLSSLVKKPELKQIDISEDEELKGLADAKAYIESSIGCNIEILKEEESKSERATRAMPLKPSLDVVL